MDEELKRLQGSWTIANLEMDGRKMPAGTSSGAKVIIDGDKFTSLGMGAVYEGRMRVDSSKTPKMLDIEFVAGPEKGNTSYAIFDVEGDTLKLCLSTGASKRPQAFTTAPNSGHAFEVLVRDKGASAQPQAASAAQPSVAQPSGAFANIAAEPVPELEGEWEMAECVRDGQPLDKMMIGCGKRIAKGGESSTHFGPQLFSRAKYVVDASQQPKTIDHYHVEGQMAGQRQLGIYEIEGDRLRISFASPGMKRPLDFSASPGDGRTITLWRRK